MSQKRAQFYALLTKLALAHNRELSADAMSIYWEDLGGLPYVLETLQEARKVSYNGFLPAIPDLISLHKKIAEKQREKALVDEQTRNLLQIKSHQSEKEPLELRACVFAKDVSLHFRHRSMANFNDRLYDMILDKEVKIPENYTKERGEQNIIIPYLKAILVKYFAEDDLEVIEDKPMANILSKIL